jgi:predicted Zn-dependent peptidase
MIITAAGRLDADRFIEQVEGLFGKLAAAGNGFQPTAPQPEPALTTRVKEELTQAQLCLGVPCYELTHEKRYAMNLLANILGGGMSSRLFQRVREQEGLAYAVFADLSAYRDAGCLGVYAGTAPENLPKLLGLVMEEIARMKKEAVPEEELLRAKESLKGGLLISLESTAARMGSLARQEIYFGRQFDVEEILARLEAVEAGEIQELANQFFVPEKAAVTVLGNLKDFSLSRETVSF